MHDLMECTRCGHVFCEDRACRRVTMRAVSHVRPGDCEPAEDLPTCPECRCVDLDEPILSAADLECRLAVMYPRRSIEVKVEAHRFVHGYRTARSVLVHVEIEAPPGAPDRRPVTATGPTPRAAIHRARKAEARRQRRNETPTRETSPPGRRAAPGRLNTRQDDGDQR